jgi:hypothetical protein
MFREIAHELPALLDGKRYRATGPAEKRESCGLLPPRGSGAAAPGNCRLSRGGKPLPTAATRSGKKG